MKSILITIVCITFSLLMNAQTADSVKTTESNNLNNNKIEKEVFLVVEESPEFPGGQDAMMKFLGDNITYPKEALDAFIHGTVYVTFIVEQDGSVSNVKVLRGIGGGCDEEAMRVVQSMPKWIPGKQRGEPVRVQYSLPIRFVLHGAPKTEKNKKNKSKK